MSEPSITEQAVAYLEQCIYPAVERAKAAERASLPVERRWYGASTAARSVPRLSLQILQATVRSPR